MDTQDTPWIRPCIKCIQMAHIYINTKQWVDNSAPTFNSIVLVSSDPFILISSSDSFSFLVVRSLIFVLKMVRASRLNSSQFINNISNKQIVKAGIKNHAVKIFGLLLLYIILVSLFKMAFSWVYQVYLLQKKKHHWSYAELKRRPLSLVFIHVLAGCTTTLDASRCMGTNDHKQSQPSQQKPASSQQSPTCWTFARLEPRCAVTCGNW